MESTTSTETRAHQLRDPLLQQQLEELHDIRGDGDDDDDDDDNTNTNKQLSRRRDHCTNSHSYNNPPDDCDVEALELDTTADVADHPSDNYYWPISIGPQELRVWWILFQCLWPPLTIVLMYGQYGIPDAYGQYGIPDASAFLVFFVVALVPVFFVWFACKQNDRFSFQWRDCTPTALWIIMVIASDGNGWMDVVIVAVTIAIVVVMIRILLLRNIYKKLEDDFFEQEQQREEVEEQKLAAQQARLSYLEELPRTKKSSTRMIVVLAILATLRLLSLLF